MALIPTTSCKISRVNEMAESTIQFITDDGQLLVGKWHRPMAQASAMAIINSATGVPQSYYSKFAQWLVDRGYMVLTYDYRGIGASRKTAPRKDPSSMRQWALHDIDAAINTANSIRREQARPLPLVVIGHSFGGHAIGLAKGINTVDAILGVAAQSGDWRNWPLKTRWITFLYFNLILPVVVAAFGYAPGWVLGTRNGLPRNVARDWSRWCRSKGYLFSDPTLAEQTRGYGQYEGVVHLWGISDDSLYGPPRAIRALASQFKKARLSVHELLPQRLGKNALGHFGVFRASAGPAAWELLLTPVEQECKPLASALLRRT